MGNTLHCCCEAEAFTTTMKLLHRGILYIFLSIPSHSPFPFPWLGDGRIYFGMVLKQCSNYWLGAARIYFGGYSYVVWCSVITIWQSLIFKDLLV